MPAASSHASNLSNVTSNSSLASEGMETVSFTSTPAGSGNVTPVGTNAGIKLIYNQIIMSLDCNSNFFVLELEPLLLVFVNGYGTYSPKKKRRLQGEFEAFFDWIQTEGYPKTRKAWLAFDANIMLAKLRPIYTPSSCCCFWPQRDNKQVTDLKNAIKDFQAEYNRLNKFKQALEGIKRYLDGQANKSRGQDEVLTGKTLKIETLLERIKHRKKAIEQGDETNKIREEELSDVISSLKEQRRTLCLPEYCRPEPTSCQMFRRAAVMFFSNPMAQTMEGQVPVASARV